MELGFGFVVDFSFNVERNSTEEIKSPYMVMTLSNV